MRIFPIIAVLALAASLMLIPAVVSEHACTFPIGECCVPEPNKGCYSQSCIIFREPALTYSSTTACAGESVTISVPDVASHCSNTQSDEAGAFQRTGRPYVEVKLKNGGTLLSRGINFRYDSQDDEANWQDIYHMGWRDWGPRTGNVLNGFRYCNDNDRNEEDVFASFPLLIPSGTPPGAYPAESWFSKEKSYAMKCDGGNCNAAHYDLDLIRTAANDRTITIPNCTRMECKTFTDGLYSVSYSGCMNGACVEGTRTKCTNGCTTSTGRCVGACGLEGDFCSRFNPCCSGTPLLFCNGQARCASGGAPRVIITGPDSGSVGETLTFNAEITGANLVWGEIYVVPATAGAQETILANQTLVSSPARMSARWTPPASGTYRVYGRVQYETSAGPQLFSFRIFAVKDLTTWAAASTYTWCTGKSPNSPEALCDGSPSKDVTISSRISCVSPCPAHCSNGVRDSDETGVDCGGSDCTGCGGPIPSCTMVASLTGPTSSEVGKAMTFNGYVSAGTGNQVTKADIWTRNMDMPGSPFNWGCNADTSGNWCLVSRIGCCSQVTASFTGSFTPTREGRYETIIQGWSSKPERCTGEDPVPSQWCACVNTAGDKVTTSVSPNPPSSCAGGAPAPGCIRPSYCCDVDVCAP